MNTIIVQARTGSKRFPNKILRKIEGVSILERCLTGCLDSKVGQIVVAIPKENKEIRKICDVLGVRLFIWGNDENDVLSRYYLCAREYKADPIVRITADCPFIQGHMIKRVLSLLENYDYVANTFPNWLVPSGYDVEAFTYSALSYAHRNAFEDYDREHVTPYIKRNMRIRVITLNDLKLSIDTKEEFDKLKKVC